jgi:RNA polymerase sigma factor (sigma-70 family)
VGIFGIALARLRNFHDAEDVAQGVFVEAFERLDRLKDPCRLGGWLRSITIHRCIDDLRKRTEVVGVEAIDAHVSDPDTPQTEMEKQELRDRVMAAIGRLSRTQQETTILFYINGYSQKEVAAIQEVPLGTVKRRLHDARHRLKEEMMDMVEEVLKEGAPKEAFAERVFELLCRYPNIHPNWDRVEAELKKIGTPGIEGFIRAFALPHARTRTWTVKMLNRAKPQPTELVVDLLKKGLKDTNKKVRRSAAHALLQVDVSDERKRKEFIPSIAELFFDPSKKVRGYLASGWPLDRYAADIPPEVIAEAAARETDPGIRTRMQNLLVRILNQ